MNPLLAFLLLVPGAVPVSAPVAAPVEPHVHTAEVRVQPGGAVQEFVLDCRPGQSVLSGGFRHASPELRILGSYPVKSASGVPGVGQRLG